MIFKDFHFSRDFFSCRMSSPTDHWNLSDDKNDFYAILYVTLYFTEHFIKRFSFIVRTVFREDTGFSMTKPMIELHQVTLMRGEKLLLEDADFILPEGKTAVIHGPSGCGKSSLLCAIAGLFPVQAGVIWVDGLELTPRSASEIRCRIAYIPQEPLMCADHVKDAMELPFTFKAHAGKKTDEKQMTEILEQLCLPSSILHRESLNLSGGEKQRVAIARAVLLGKTIFLADEITSSLDAESREAVQALLRSRNYTLLASSHDAFFLSSGDVLHYRLGNGKLLSEDKTPADDKGKMEVC